jgi:6-phosphogluconolactonase
MSEPRIVVVADEEEVGATAAALLADAVRDAVTARGVAHIATTGGSGAPPIYRALSDEPLRGRIPWEAIHVWWGDDRFVPREHELSNVRPFDEALRRDGGPPLARERIHPFPVNRTLAADEDEAWCAAELERELRAAGVEERGGWPVLDAVLLGVGGDGHILSVFPGSEALDDPRWALPIPAPTHIEPHVPRVTLNPAIVTVARSVIVVSAGEGKADILAEILRGPVDPRRLPAQLARADHATWVLDGPAASGLA